MPLISRLPLLKIVFKCSFSISELPSNFNFDDDLICRLAVKWSVPFEDLGRNLPHIRDKVKSGNYELRETEDLGDAEEENRALFFFQFPLSEDCIILVDSISSYAAACAELLVRACVPNQPCCQHCWLINLVILFFSLSAT